MSVSQIPGIETCEDAARFDVQVIAKLNERVELFQCSPRVVRRYLAVVIFVELDDDVLGYGTVEAATLLALFRPVACNARGGPSSAR